MRQVLLCGVGDTTYSLSALSLWFGHKERECSSANTTAWVIFPHLDSKYIAFPLSSFPIAKKEFISLWYVPTTGFQALCLPLPSHPFLDTLIRKPGTPPPPAVLGCMQWFLPQPLTIFWPFLYLSYSLAVWVSFLFILESSVMWISIL